MEHSTEPLNILHTHTQYIYRQCHRRRNHRGTGGTCPPKIIGERSRPTSGVSPMCMHQYYALAQLVRVYIRDDVSYSYPHNTPGTEYDLRWMSMVTLGGYGTCTLRSLCPPKTYKVLAPLNVRQKAEVNYSTAPIECSYRMKHECTNIHTLNTCNVHIHTVSSVYQPHHSCVGGMCGPDSLHSSPEPLDPKEHGAIPRGLDRECAAARGLCGGPRTTYPLHDSCR